MRKLLSRLMLLGVAWMLSGSVLAAPCGSSVRLCDDTNSGASSVFSPTNSSANDNDGKGAEEFLNGAEESPDTDNMLLYMPLLIESGGFPNGQTNNIPTADDPQPTRVPAPAPAALLALGLGLLFARRRRGAHTSDD